MEKGFNDDELADIMSEIESLEQEFAADDEVAKAQEPGIDEVAQSVAAMAEEEAQAPVEEMVTEAPVEEVVAQVPVEEVVAQVPVEEVVAQVPVEEVVAEVPVEEVVAQVPIEEVLAEAPVEEAPVEEVPVEEVVAQAPVEEVVAVAPKIEHEQASEEVVTAMSDSDHESKLDQEMNSVLDELTDMKVDDVVPENDIQSYDDNIHHMKVEQDPQENVMGHTKHKPSSTAKTAMSFSVEGDMKLDLSFIIGGSEVQLHVSDEGFEIELEGGAKFSLPVNSTDSAKKAA